MTRRACALAALLIALSACGGSGTPVATTSSGASSASKTGGPSPTGTAGGRSPSPNASSTASPSAGATIPSGAPDHVPGTIKAPIEVTMGAACVVRGTAQRITVRSTPGFQISWATLYPDGKAHQEYNGYGLGVIPPTGTYTLAWSIPANAPLGDARSDVAVAGKVNGRDSTAYGHGYFTIATSC